MSGGGILFWNGVNIANHNEISFYYYDITEYAGGRFVMLEFSGCLIAVLFMVSRVTWHSFYCAEDTMHVRSIMLCVEFW